MPSPHHGSRAPSLTPRRWIDALDATFHCEAPLRRPKPLSGEASLGRKPLFRAEAWSDTPGAEARSVSDRSIKPGAGHPRTPGRTGKLGNLYACKRLNAGRWTSLPAALRRLQPTLGVGLGLVWPVGPCPCPAYTGIKAAIAAGGPAPLPLGVGVPRSTGTGQRPASVFHRQPKTQQTEQNANPNPTTKQPDLPHHHPLPPP